jgi:hypothetical protein
MPQKHAPVLTLGVVQLHCISEKQAKKEIL